MVIGVDGSGRSHVLAELQRAHRGLIVDLSPLPGESDHPLEVVRRSLGRSLDAVDDAFAALADRLGDRTLFVVDDAHRLDDESAGILTRLVNRGAGVALARRPIVDRPAVAGLDAALARTARIVEVTPLSAVTFASTFGDRIPQGHLRCGGLAGWGAALVDDPSGATIRLQVQHRLAELPPTALDLARGLSLSGGRGLDVERAAMMVGISLDRLEPLVEGLWVRGLVDDPTSGTATDGAIRLIPVVAEAVASILTTATRRSLHLRLAALALGEPGAEMRAAEHWREAGVRDSRSAGAFATAARIAAAADVGAATAWIDLAVESGADDAEILTTADLVATATGGPLRSVAPETARTSTDRPDPLMEGLRAAYDGHWERAAAVLVASSSPAHAVPVLVGLARFDEAARLAETTSAPEPTALDEYHRALLDLVGPDPTPRLVRAVRALRRVGSTELLAEEPEIIGASIAALSEGAGAWESFLPEPRQPGTNDKRQSTAAERRAALFRAFLQLRRGIHAPALQLVTDTADHPRTGREELLLAALRAGLDRRAGRPSAQELGWSTIAGAVVEATVDGYFLEPLEELLIAAARAGDARRVGIVISHLDAFAARCGPSTVWATQAAWISVQVAVAVDDVGSLIRAAERLDGQWEPGTRRAACALAARAWIPVLERKVTDIGAVTDAAKALLGCGLSFEAGQLLSAAALDLRLDDPRTATLLKMVQEGSRRGGVVAGASQGGAGDRFDSALANSHDGGGESTLSSREIQVAELKFLGYRNQDIAERLYIGVKTVETHVTRLNTKLAVSSRAEFLEAYGAYRSRVPIPAGQKTEP